MFTNQYAPTTTKLKYTWHLCPANTS